jgi:hypothetical protein
LSSRKRDGEQLPERRLSLADHSYYAVCIIRTSLPFADLQDALQTAVERPAPSEKVISVKVLSSAKGGPQAERLWNDIMEGDRIKEELKRNPAPEPKSRPCHICGRSG